MTMPNRRGFIGWVMALLFGMFSRRYVPASDPWEVSTTTAKIVELPQKALTIPAGAMIFGNVQRGDGYAIFVNQDGGKSMLEVELDWDGDGFAIRNTGRVIESWSE